MSFHGHFDNVLSQYKWFIYHPWNKKKTFLIPVTDKGQPGQQETTGKHANAITREQQWSNNLLLEPRNYQTVLLHRRLIKIFHHAFCFVLQLITKHSVVWDLDMCLTKVSGFLTHSYTLKQINVLYCIDCVCIYSHHQTTTSGKWWHHFTRYFFGFFAILLLLPME